MIVKNMHGEDVVCEAELDRCIHLMLESIEKGMPIHAELYADNAAHFGALLLRPTWTKPTLEILNLNDAKHPCHVPHDPHHFHRSC